MCKYCKHLKEIKNEEKKFYVDLINAWRRRDLDARHLVARLFGLLSLSDACSSDVVADVKEFLECDYVGK